MGKKWLDPLLQFHISSSEWLLNCLQKYLTFDSSQSRWAFISTLAMCVQFFIAIFLALYGVYVSLFALYYGDECMIGYVIATFGIAITFGIIALLGFIFTLWIALYFMRNPLESTMESDIHNIKISLTSLKGIEESLRHINNKIDNLEITVHEKKDTEQQY
jgi:hypothetical protein